MESENRGQLIRLEKGLRDEGDKVMKLERDLDRAFSERKHLWPTVGPLDFLRQNFFTSIPVEQFSSVADQ